MIMKNHLDMKDEHSELEDFYGISGKFFDQWPEIEVIVMLVMLVTLL